MKMKLFYTNPYISGMKKKINRKNWETDLNTTNFISISFLTQNLNLSKLTNFLFNADEMW